MEFIIGSVVVVAILAAGTTVVVLRERRTRDLAGDADASMPGDRLHSEAIAGAHAAGASKRAF
ncbi:hypothetical protein [Agromyces sp. NPDC058110]|uniref:hypothetical protein n=1 Tax=Agromyces sp. NPDC058110 TaxID=3346345 RepID=UPI0036D85130